MDHLRFRACFAVGFSVLLCSVLYLLFRDFHFGTGDEGYLWYGVKRTLAGEVPLRDFQSYDPGRYYWCAAFAPLIGDGILGLRLATAAFQALGLSFALLVAARFARGWLELAFCGLILGLWMFPRHKLFEPALASTAVWFAVRLLERPSSARHFAAGLFSGMAGFFGRNHAFYAAAATGLLIALVAWKEHGGMPWTRARAWAIGIVAGSLPMLSLFLFVPGFAASFVESNRLILKHGTNLPLAYPWPWLTNWSELGGWDLACQAGLSAAFLLPCIVLPVGLVRALRRSGAEIRAHAVSVASAVVGLFYVHHMSVRSHWSHLAECLGPVLLLTLALGASPWRRWLRPAVWGALALLSALAFLEVHSLFAQFKPGNTLQLVECEVDGERLRLPRDQARLLQNLEAFVTAVVPPDETIFIAPGRPGLYPILGRVAPTWWIYFFWTADEEEQQALIHELAQRGVNWVLILNPGIDDVEERRFLSTHPLVWQHLSDFERVGTGNLGPRYSMFRRRR